MSSALIRAEALKLVRRRGLMIWTAILTLAPTLIALIVVVALHAANPARYGPAGGTDEVEHVTALSALVSTLAAIILGATAGGQDLSSGVFRDLAITGRPRGQLFDARIPGALLVFLPFIVVNFAVIVAAGYAFADGRTVGTADVGRSAAFFFARMIVNVVLAVALTAIVSSRIVIGVLIGWDAVVANILIALKPLGGWRNLVDETALNRLGPQNVTGDDVHTSVLTAIVVLVAWTAIAFAAGRMRTERRDA